MSSENLHEPLDRISERTIDLHRAIVSLIEELDAVDWYNQRAEATHDAELRSVLIHHRNEEIEHAMMNLEWIRRMMPEFDEKIRTYIFSEGPITLVEAEKEKGAVEAGTAGQARAPAPATGGAPSAPARQPSGGSLGIGSLKRG